METYGVAFDGKHTGKDYGLEWVNPLKLEFPDAKGDSIDLPGQDGNLDLTPFWGDVKYKNRKAELHFRYDGDYTSWHIVSSRIANDLHGQRCKVICDTEPDFVYYATVSVEAEKENLMDCDIAIILDADPYKYERYGSLEKWVWGTFSFRTGIIRDYNSLAVDGTLSLTVPGRRKKVVPVFECSEAMTVEYAGQAYGLPAGRSKILDLQLGEGEHVLTFTGSGTVSVDYRGGSL